jgi:DNA repair exonuclease SbcCD nuclease subunit
MMDIKILATADLHLGMKFATYPDVQSKLSRARFEALQRLVDLANREKCHLFIIAGDTFDRVTVAKKDVLQATAALNEFQGNVAAVMPGNHDYTVGGSSSLWNTFRENAGDRVLVLDEQKVYDLDHFDLELKLYAGPCHAKRSDKNAIAWIEERGTAAAENSGDLSIGVAHGALEGAAMEGDYFPMRLRDLERLGLDFWIIGHSHVQEPFPNGEDGRILVPGTPEPDGFNCTHEGRAWIVTAKGKETISCRPVRTGRYRFRKEDVVLRKQSDLKGLFAPYASKEYENALVQLAISGRVTRPMRQELQDTIMDLESSLFHMRCDTTGLAEEITWDTVRKEFSEGSFPHLLLHRLIEEGNTLALQIAYDMIQEARK